MDHLDIFGEQYKDGEDSDSDDELESIAMDHLEEGDVEEEEDEMKLGITAAEARANYEAAGSEVNEEEDRITIADNTHLMNSDVNAILDKVVDEIQMPYKPAEFQRVAINALVGLNNVILISPTGSGKMNVPLLATLVLREKLGIPKGVCIVTQPLSSIMKEKMKNDVCPAAVLSMGGGLTTSTDTDDEDASLSCNLDELLQGSFPVLFGHPESFDTKIGQHILKNLQKLDRLILICIDEFHQGGQGHWSSFRPSMMQGSAGLRLFGVKNCPSLAMTATSTESEIKEVVTALGLRSPPIILTSSPVQSHIKISIVRRPANNFGLDGTVTSKGEKKPGLMDLLLRACLRQHLEDLERGKKPKKCLIFCRGNGVLGAIYSRLMELTNYKYKDCRDSPIVMNHSSLLPPTEKVLADRSSEISLYLTTNKMLLGIDLAEIDLVIFLRPYNQPAALIQGGGRGGRRLESGKRRRVQVYQFFNSQDFSSQNKMMSPDMKRICLSKDCTRKLLKEYFVGDEEEEEDVGEEVKRHCCHNCDRLAVS